MIEKKEDLEKFFFAIRMFWVIHKNFLFRVSLHSSLMDWKLRFPSSLNI